LFLYNLAADSAVLEPQIALFLNRGIDGSGTAFPAVLAEPERVQGWAFRYQDPQYRRFLNRQTVPPGQRGRWCTRGRPGAR
jgi:hypothetical protein